MSGSAPGRFSAALDLLRPRTFFRTLARVDSLVDSTRSLAQTVDALRVQTAQLTAIQQIDWERRFDLTRLDKWLDAERIGQHVSAAIEAVPLELEPFPHMVVENWLPQDVYDQVLDAMPPAIFFQSTRDEHWALRSGIAPLYCRQVWAFVANTLAGDILHRALNAKFERVIRDYIQTFCPAFPSDAPVTMHPSDGRLMLRRPGYDLQAHRDPKWGFVTALMYLAKPGDSEAFGTQIYSVRDDVEAPNANVYYVERERCRLVRDVPFRANSLLVFLNSVGAHGAAIPPDAQPATLERYIYQFRLGPTSKTIAQMMQLMTPERAARWAGSKASRLAY